MKAAFRRRGGGGEEPFSSNNSRVLCGVPSTTTTTTTTKTNQRNNDSERSSSNTAAIRSNKTNLAWLSALPHKLNCVAAAAHSSYHLDTESVLDCHRPQCLPDSAVAFGDDTNDDCQDDRDEESIFFPVVFAEIELSHHHQYQLHSGEQEEADECILWDGTTPTPTNLPHRRSLPRMEQLVIDEKNRISSIVIEDAEHCASSSSYTGRYRGTADSKPSALVAPLQNQEEDEEVPFDERLFTYSPVRIMMYDDQGNDRERAIPLGGFIQEGFVIEFPTTNSTIEPTDFASRQQCHSANCAPLEHSTDAVYSQFTRTKDERVVEPLVESDRSFGSSGFSSIRPNNAQTLSGLQRRHCERRTGPEAFDEIFQPQLPVRYPSSQSTYRRFFSPIEESEDKTTSQLASDNNTFTVVAVSPRANDSSGKLLYSKNLYSELHKPIPMRSFPSSVTTTSGATWSTSQSASTAPSPKSSSRKNGPPKTTLGTLDSHFRVASLRSPFYTGSTKKIHFDFDESYSNNPEEEYYAATVDIHSSQSPSASVFWRTAPFY